MLDIASCTEEALRLLERIGIDTTGEYLTGGGLDCIVGACEAGDGVEEDHYIVSALY